MATYRTIQIHNVSALVQSIYGVTDLITLYGIEIVSHGQEDNTTVSNENSTKRKLYTNDVEKDLLNAKHDNMTLPYIFEILLDMLDDERDEVRYKAVFAITVLIKNSFSVTPSMLSRLLLKWYSPITERQDERLQVRLGLLIEKFMLFKNSGQVIKEALIPTLSSIVNAPKTSPLVEIDVDNVLMFFVEMVNICLQKDELRILALDICMKISESSNDRVTTLLTKFLCHLDLIDNAESLTELIDRAEMLLENTKDKISKKHIQKFVLQLRQQSQSTINMTERTNEITETSTNNEQSNVMQVSSEDKQTKPQQIKRKKRRNSRDCVVVLERLDLNNINEVHLPPTLESGMERMHLDEDSRIETPTTDSSKSASGHTNNIVISETSDSELSNDNEMGTRRSSRLRKKRIL